MEKITVTCDYMRTPSKAETSNVSQNTYYWEAHIQKVKKSLFDKVRMVRNLLYSPLDS